MGGMIGSAVLLLSLMVFACDAMHHHGQGHNGPRQHVNNGGELSCKLVELFIHSVFNRSVKS